MKTRDNLALRLTTAATTPLLSVEAAPNSKKKATSDTLQVTLRPSRNLYSQYVGLAADRSKIEGRNVTAQEIMLEVLARGQA
jgi:hypothetical protein